MFTLAESDPKLSKEEAGPLEAQLRTNLLKAQYSLLKQQKRALLIVIAGIGGVGKGASVQLLNEWMDARHIRTLALDQPASVKSDQLFLLPYWQNLPAKGKTSIIFGHWYRPLLKEAGRKKPRARKIKALARTINEFENTLAHNGVQVVKLWYHLSKHAQKKRCKKLLSDPDTSWQVRPADLKVEKHFSRLRQAAETTLSLTHEAHAPWVVIPAADNQMRDISTAQAVLAALRKRHISPASCIIQTDGLDSSSTQPNLQQVDHSATLDEDDYDKQLPELQGRLAKLVRDKQFSNTRLVLVFEGQDAAGKGGTIRRVTHALDPRQFRATPISAPNAQELAHPYLWRFWRDLPEPGKISIFDRSWYGRVLVERVEGFASEEEWQRAYSEINQFESSLLDSGAVVLKFWLSIDKKEQLKRFRERQTSPFKSFKITPEDWRNRKQWDAYVQATNDMFLHTSTQDCPWHLISSNDKRHARVAVLERIVQALETSNRKN